MQKMKRKQILTCLLAAALALPLNSMQVNSEGEEEAVTDPSADASENSAGEDTIVIEEEQEEFDVSPEEVAAYMTPLGEVDGYAVYLRPTDYKDMIEAEFESTSSGETSEEEDEDAEDADDIIKKFKDAEAAIIDTSTGQVTAVFEKVAETDESVVYFSQAGRYLLHLNAEQTKPQQLRYRVSTIDSPYLFLTQDKNTLELYSTDYKEVRAVMTLEEQDTAQCIYRSSDKSYWAMLNAAQNQALACVKQAAENDNMVLYVDEDNAILALENKKNGYIWWSSPLGANRDTRATSTLVNELQSSVVLTYGDRENFSITNQRSANAASLKVSEISDGVEITYTFDKCGISIPVCYRLADDYMEASVDCTKIQETKTDDGIVATQLTLLGSFGAAGSKEEGYFVLPDGCGAIINFNNGKETTKSYSQKVYGRDITIVPTTKPAVTEGVHLPVYGIVKEDNALAVVIDEGDGNATLNASVSGQSLSSYNICSYNFTLRGSDTYYLSGDDGNLTVFEDGAIKTPSIKLRYYPIAEEDADYVDVAEVYRNYLTTECGVTPKAEANETELYLDLYGGTMSTQSILGIPVNMKTSMTSYSEAKEIVSSLTDLGVDDMVVIYNNWTNEGISGKVDNKAKPSGTLGGKGEFNDLTSYLEEHYYAFYPSVDNLTFKSGNGYYTFLDTTIRISGSYSRQIQYTLSYGVQDPTVKTQSLLSPDNFLTIYTDLAANYTKKGLTGVSLGQLTSTLYGDYGKVGMSRQDTMTTLQNSYQVINDAGMSILADTCAAYALPYVSRISDMPLQSSGFDVFDGDIPFYQIVIHGIIPYSGTAINASADSTGAYLTTIATGANPAYDMIYADASDLKDTDLDEYFYSHYEYWINDAAEEYKLASEILSGVSDQTIVAYTKENTISVTVYSNGTTIEVDYDAETITVDGTVYSVSDEDTAAEGE